MAFSATMVWEVRTTGSDSNGGGFDPTSGVPGTDYSQQDSPQVTYTDLVIDGTTNTKCTSAGTPFTSAHVGNVINITSGTGFTVQRVQILSVTAAVATCDKSLGTTSSTGGNGKLGGGVATIATAYDIMQSGNTTWIKSGTYTITTGFTCPNILLMSFQVIGYQITRGDNTGTRPIVTTSTNSINMWDWPGSTPLDSYLFQNLKFTNTAGTPGSCFYASPHVPYLTVRNCIISGFNVGINGSGAGAPYDFTSLVVDQCEVANCTSHGIINSSQSVITNCYIHDCGGIGFASTGLQTITPQFVASCIFYKNNIGLKCLANNAGDPTRYIAFVLNCTFHTNTGAGLYETSTYLLYVENCIFYANTTYGISTNNSSCRTIISQTNAFGAQGTANYFIKNQFNSSITSQPTDITLTADPCTNAAGGDFSLNSTAGGGAACKAAGTQFA